MGRLPSRLYLVGMLIGFAGGSFCGIVLEIEGLAILGFILFLYCWVRLAIGKTKEVK